MIAQAKAIEMRVCFENRLKNTDILIGTMDREEARRVARTWGEKAEGEPVTRTIFRGHADPHNGPTTSIDDVTVWLPLF